MRNIGYAPVAIEQDVLVALAAQARKLPLIVDNSENLIFCARPDGSGFSDFAETYKQHKQNARRYQHRLDSLGVKR